MLRTLIYPLHQQFLFPSLSLSFYSSLHRTAISLRSVFYRPALSVVRGKREKRKEREKNLKNYLHYFVLSQKLIKKSNTFLYLLQNKEVAFQVNYGIFFNFPNINNNNLTYLRNSADLYAVKLKKVNNWIFSDNNIILKGCNFLNL